MGEDGPNGPLTHPENCHFNSDTKLQISNLQKIASRCRYCHLLAYIVGYLERTNGLVCSIVVVSFDLGVGICTKIHNDCVREFGAA